MSLFGQFSFPPFSLFRFAFSRMSYSLSRCPYVLLSTLVHKSISFISLLHPSIASFLFCCPFQFRPSFSVQIASCSPQHFTLCNCRVFATFVVTAQLCCLVLGHVFDAEVLPDVHSPPKLPSKLKDQLHSYWYVTRLFCRAEKPEPVVVPPNCVWVESDAGPGNQSFTHCYWCSSFYPAFIAMSTFSGFSDSSLFGPVSRLLIQGLFINFLDVRN